MSQTKEPKVVVIGGGTGMPVLLRGLKHLPIDLIAIVTVADDGGSTGRIRSEMDIPAPGDIRNVIAALSDAEPMLVELFQHRFEESNGKSLSGHSLGNLLLAAMTSVTGDFYDGIQEISRVLNVKGTIYPISTENFSLHAKMVDGTVVSGESNIPLSNKKIDHVFLSPEPVKPFNHAVQAIIDADLIVIGPGSLFTSIMPNLIVPSVKEALEVTSAKIVYVCNLMTQAGETTGYTASEHVEAINKHIGSGIVQAIVVHNEPIRTPLKEKYAVQNAEPVIYDTERLLSLGLEIIEGDIISKGYPTVRHDNDKIAQLLYSLLK